MDIDSVVQIYKKYKPHFEFNNIEGVWFEKENGLNYWLNLFPQIGSRAYQPFNVNLLTTKESIVYQSSTHDLSFPTNAKAYYGYIGLQNSLYLYINSLDRKKAWELKKYIDKIKDLHLREVTTIPIKELPSNYDSFIFNSQNLTLNTLPYLQTIGYKILEVSLYADLVGYIVFKIENDCWYYGNSIILKEGNWGNILTLAQINQAIALGLKEFDMENIAFGIRTNYKKKFFTDKILVPIYTNTKNLSWIIYN